MSTVFNCDVIELKKNKQKVGSSTSVESGLSFPFEIKRVYYIYDVPGGSDRGGHAHKELEQFIIATSGAFEVVLDDGKNRKTIRLDRPNFALHIRKGIWRETKNFTSGSICMVLASEVYAESDYIYDYKEYLKYKNEDPNNVPR
ncbi:MAG: FdtA/QdtA family cupin domain-containing protein [Crocinitomicaceae bacterium]|nr:FdtA/QdtA family cupin domain-containing protein [Crocinitomicaceae bacterium]